MLISTPRSNVPPAEYFITHRLEQTPAVQLSSTPAVVIENRVAKFHADKKDLEEGIKFFTQCNRHKVVKRLNAQLLALHHNYYFPGGMVDCDNDDDEDQDASSGSDSSRVKHKKGKKMRFNS